MDEPKTIAGLHCFDVLEHLDDYVAGVLDDELVARVNQHLAGCGACESFGGRYAALVKALRAQMDEVPSESARQLAAELWRTHSDG